MTFTLFDNEENVTARAEAALNELPFGSAEARAAFASLLDAYRRSLREQRRMVRLGDRLQDQLNTANRELERRREEAEEALHKLRDAQGHLIQAEKLASLGGLVAGVAHEINTPVGVAVTAASILAERVQALRKSYESGALARSDFTEFMETAEEASRLVLSNAERAASLIQSFKQVSADQTASERRVFALRPYLEEVLVSLSPRLKRAGHKVTVDCPEGLEVDTFPGALFQVVANLVMNSLQHAFEPGATGNITIAVTKEDGDILEIRYCDDGKGIPADIIDRVFDPFFTTKRGSGGTGLGLHIVYSIVTGTLGGHIAIASTPGEGITLTMLVPRAAPRRGATA